MRGNPRDWLFDSFLSKKWVYDAGAKQWKLAYTLQNGLNLGQPHSVADYPVGNNAATGLPWAPATAGLRKT